MRLNFIIMLFFVLSFYASGQKREILPVQDTITSREPGKNYSRGKASEPLILNSPAASERVGTIKFPNAFRWNHMGSNGGYWTENSAADNTFRPVFTNVASYHLRIFNRGGNLIYESREINKGWDGYLRNGALAPQAVYIWQVKGHYADGSSFDKIGDVTFLY